MAVKKTNKVLGIEREHDGVSLDSLLDKWYNEERLSTLEIAEKCNVSTSTIGNWMDRYGMERRSQNKLSSDSYKPTEKELDQWYNEEELSTIQIAEKCNVTNGTIGKWMDKYGMERRSQNKLSSDAYKPNKEELDKWYNEERLTTIQIAEKCNVTHPTIGRWMDKYEMERRSQNKLSSDAYKPNKEELHQWYNEEGQTLSEIAEKCNVIDSTIGRWMDKYEMERRPSPVGQEKEPEYTIEQACEAYLKYEKTTAIPVDLRTFFNIFDPETLQRAEGTPPLRVYIGRWKRERDK